MQVGPSCLWQVPACASVRCSTTAGLDQALLGNAAQTGDKSKDDQHIHDLVKLGAHLLVRLLQSSFRSHCRFSASSLVRLRPLSRPHNCLLGAHPSWRMGRQVVSLYLVHLKGVSR